MVDTLNTYGYSFQVKILTALITDQKFTTKIYDTLDPKELDNKALGWLIDKTFQYYSEYNIPPSLDVFAVQISNLTGTFMAETRAVLKEAYGNMGCDDLSFVKDKTIEFCRHQIIKNSLPTLFDLFQEGKYDEAVATLNKAYQKGLRSDDVGLDYLNDIDLRYVESVENARVKTGWDTIDDIIGGGLPKGKFAAVIAPTGVGKSWVLCQLGYVALKAGCTVLHYTLELDANYVGRRYDSIATGITMDDLKFNISKIKKSVSKFGGKLIIKEFPPSTLSVQGFEADIERSIMLGIVPDLVILDYPELLIVPYNNNMREDKVLGELYKDLRGVSGRKNFALWGCDQANREALSKEVIENDSVSNSYAKLFALDLVMTVSRRPKDKTSNTARIHVSKNRLGPDGLTFPMRFDTGTGKFEVYNENTKTGNRVKSDMVSVEEYAKQMVSERWQQSLMNSNREEPTDLF